MCTITKVWKFGPDIPQAGFTVVNEGLKALWQPDDEALAQALEFGKALAGM